MSLPAGRLYSWTEYIELELESNRKHEYFEGQLTAMTGGSIAHSLVGSALARELWRICAGTGCRVHSSDQRLVLPDKPRAYYPDVSVTCGPLVVHPEDPHAISDATLVGEVHSPRTIVLDRQHKLYEYQSLPSCRFVLFAFPQKVRIDRFARQPDDTWELTTFGAGEQVPLMADRLLSVDDVYDAIPLDPRGVAWRDSI